jgi:hypothetical protein
LRAPSSAARRHRLPKAAIAFYGPPNSPLNPTKNTPSYITVLDQGEATVLSEESGKFIKLKLKAESSTGSSPWRVRNGQKCGHSQKVSFSNQIHLKRA